LNVALVPAPDQVVVRLAGEADVMTASLITDALLQAAALGTRQVIVDVAGTRFWDCAGLRPLVGFTTDLAAAGRSCRIVGASRAMRRLISAALFTDRLDLDGPLNVVADPPPGNIPAQESPHRPAADGDVPPHGRGEQLAVAGAPAVLP
jgi:anti-anti-sigma factor